MGDITPGFRIWSDVLSGFVINKERTRAALFDTVDAAVQAGIVIGSPFRVVDASDTRRVRATWSRDAGVRLYDCAGCEPAGSGRVFVGWGRGWEPCPCCGGSGRSVRS